MASALLKEISDDFLTCQICLETFRRPKILDCLHSFCEECLKEYVKPGKAFGTPTSQPDPGPGKATAVGQRSKANGRETTEPTASDTPKSGFSSWTRKGNQPPGHMEWYTSSETRLPGYENCGGAIVISYNFPDGIQGPEHPNPGRPYKGTSKTAYLPDNEEGRELVQLLKRAFDTGLVFTIAPSNFTTFLNTGVGATVTWNIQHKTSISGGRSGNGYPDGRYMTRLRKQLAAKGIK